VAQRLGHGRNRIIPINNKILPIIQKYYNQNKENEYLISNFKNEQMKYCNYRREKFDNIMEKLRMKHCPHDCRHTTISLLNSANANSLCIKRIVGHASQDLTEDVYTHKTRQELCDTINLI
jgi:integrase